MSLVSSVCGWASVAKLINMKFVAAFGIVIATAAAASAAPVTQTSAPNLGVVSVGEVEIQLTASGGDGANYRWEYVPGFGLLPYGVSVRTDTPSWFPSVARAGLIGLAATPGTYHFRLRVSSGGEVADRDYTLIVSSLIVKNQFQAFDAFVSVPYLYPFTAQRNGAAVAASWLSTGGNYPPGVSLGPTGNLAGTPTAPGTYDFSYSVSEGGETVYKGGRINVYLNHITTDTLPNVSQGSFYSQTITAAGGSNTFNFSIGCCLPSGLFFDSATGSIAGTVNAGPGLYQFNVNANDRVNGTSVSKLLSIDVTGVPPALPTITPYYTGVFQSCSVGLACSQGIQVRNGGRAPFLWSVDSATLPPGMSLRFAIGTTSSNIAPGDAELWGNPVAAGDFPIVFTVTDADNVSTTNTFSLHVSRLQITNYLTNGTLGVPYSTTLRVIGGTGPYAATQIDGRLPLNLTLDGATQIVSGTPTENGNFNVKFYFTDSDGNWLDTWSGQNIFGPTITINNFDDLGTIGTGFSYSNQFFACCAASINWSVADLTKLPHGVGFSASGLLSGTPDTPGTYKFTVLATDASNSANYAIRQFTLIVTPVQVTTNFTLPYGNLGSQYGGSPAGLQLNATGGTGPYTWALRPGSYTPPGMTLSSSGALSGAPTSTGQYRFNVIVTDSALHVRQASFSVSIYPAGGAPPPGFNFGTNLGTWSIGQVDGVQLTGTGGNGTYAFTFEGGTPPPGLSISSDVQSYFPPGAQGLIGVATTPGPYTFQLGVTSAGIKTVQTFTMKIVNLVVKDLYSLPDTFVGQTFSRQLTLLRDGMPVPGTWTATSPLPSGVSLSPSGELHGTPDAPGFYLVSFNVSDGTDTVFRWVFYNAYAIGITTSGDVLPNATQNAFYSTPALSTVGGSGSYTYTVSGFTAGLAINSSTGVLSGNINAGTGTVSYTITATDSANTSLSYSKRFTFNVVGVVPVLPQVTAFNSVISDCTIGVPCNRVFGVQSGGSAPFVWDVQGLPLGMGFRSDSALTSSNVNPTQVEVSGTPVEAGLFTVTATVMDSTGVKGQQTFQLYVSELMTTTNTFLSGMIETPFAQQFRVIGGRPGYTMSKTGGQLVDGLAIDGGMRTISGTPHESGNFNVTVKFADSAGRTLQLPVGFFISGAGSGLVSINTGSNLGVFTQGNGLNLQLSGCCPSSLNWTRISDPSSLPPGVNLSLSGQLSGTLTASGTYTFTVRATDPANSSKYAQRVFTLIVTPIAINTNSSLPFGQVGTVYSATLTASGGTAPFTWTLAPFNLLPPGLTLSSSGQISGTPTQTGFFGFTVNVADSANHVSSRNFNVPIYPAGVYPPLNWTLGPNFGPFTVGLNSIQLSGVSGGLPPYHYRYTPGTTEVPGMRVQDGQPLPTNFPTSVTGGLVGVITAAGTYPTSIRVTDSLGNTFDRAITVTVSPLHILSQFNLPRATRNVAYPSFTFTPYPSGSYTWSASNLPAGMSLNASTGELTGTPTASGTFFPTITLRTSSNNFASVGFAINVNPYAITTDGILTQGIAGVAYSTTLAAPGCGNPCNWSIVQGSLPGGLSLNGSTGQVSGTTNGTFNNSFTVQSQGAGGAAQKVFSLRVVASVPQALAITNGTSFGYSTVGNGVAQALFAQGGTLPYTWSIDSATGTLPPGVSLQGPGETVGQLAPGFTYLAGRTMDIGSGVYNFVIKVTDSAPVPASVTLPVSWAVTPLNIGYFNLPVSFGGTVLQPLVYKQQYNQPILGLGGTGSYTWSTLSTLPAGLALDAATGVISGTPIVTGFTNVTFRAIDGTGAEVRSNISFNIAGPTPTLLFFNAGPNFGTFQQGNNLTQSLNPAGGTGGPYTLAANSALPPGLGLQFGNSLLSNGTPGTNYFVTGTPLAPGPYAFTVEARDSLGNVGAQTFTLTITRFTLFSGTTLPDASIGSPYSQTLLTTDAFSTVNWTPVTQLPAGLSVSGGVISGTPTSPGNFRFTLAATDGLPGPTLTFDFSLHVSNVSITDPQILPIVPVAGAPISYTFSAGSGLPTWSQSGLPPFLSLSSSGQLQTTGVSTAGMFSFNITATIGNDSLTRRFTLYIRLQTPTVLDYPLASTVLADAVVGQFTSYILSPTGGVPPYDWSVAPGSTLPPGFTLIRSTDIGSPSPSGLNPGLTALAGAATTPGSYVFDLIVTDSTRVQARRTFTLNETGINILPGTPRNATTGVAYTEQFTPVGGVAPYTFTMTPANYFQDMLPTGLSFSTGGVISGTPTSTGNYAFILHLQDSNGLTFARTYTFTVNNAFGLRVTSFNALDRQVGSAGTVVSLSTSGASTYTWFTPGGLPDGLVLISSPPAIVGSPRAVGSYVFTARATDNANSANVADHTFSFNVTPMYLVSPPLPFMPQFMLPSGNVNFYYSFTFKAAGGALPYVFTPYPYSPLPPGLTLSSDGLLSGYPTSVGNFAVGVTFTDANNHVFHVPNGFTLIVTQFGTPAPLALTNQTFPSASVGQPYALPLDIYVRGGVPPFSWSVTSGSLPAGMKLVDGGNGVSASLGGIPTAPGTSIYNLTVLDGAGQSAAMTVSQTVSPIDLDPGGLTLPPAVVGTPYSVTLTPSGGTAPYSIQLSPTSASPAGLTLAGGVLAGTPTNAGDFLLTVLVSDGAANQLLKTYRLTIDNAAGEAPAATLTPNPIVVNYAQGAPGVASIPVNVGSTSGDIAFTLSVAGISNASVFPSSGDTDPIVKVNIDASSFGAGTYVGTLGMNAPTAANLYDFAPIVLNVMPPGSDTTLPVIGTIPVDIVAEATSAAGAIVNFFTPTATDNFYPAPTVSVNPPSGSTFPIGTTIVTVTATDASGNVTHKTFNVTVRDTIKPKVSIAAPLSGVVYRVGQFVLSSFSCDDTVRVASCVGPIPEGVAIDTTTPGTFTFLVTATDGSGNVSSASTTYNVVGSTPQSSVTFEVIHNFNGADGSAPLVGLIKGSDGNFYGTTQIGGTYGYGTVFKTDASGTVTTLHSFDNVSDGAYPFGALVEGRDGRFYGTTYYGGPNSYGTAFAVDAMGTLSVLHSFAYTDGAYPYGALVQGSDGSFYGTTNYGGPGSYGTIYKLDATGGFATLHAFTTGEGATPLAGLILGSDGYFYGTTSSYGPSGYGSVFRADASGNVTLLHAFGYADGGLPQAAVTQGRDGNLYGTTFYGGSNGYGTVFKMNTTGGAFTTLHSFAGDDGQYLSHNGVVQGPDGALYGMTFNGGPNRYYGDVFRVDAAGSFAILHAFNYSDGGNSSASLLVDSDGRLYGTTTGGGTSGAGTVFRIGLNLGAAAGSSLAVASTTGIYRGRTNVSATLTSAGMPAAGRSIAFTINGVVAGSALTDASGVATLNASLAGIGAGTYPDAIRAAFSGDVLIGASVSAPAVLIVQKATPNINWPTPGTIVEGTPLDGTQLNAASDASGTFVYSPPAGTVLPIGAGQTLSVVFTPADTANYVPTAANVLITVISATDVPDRFEVLHTFTSDDGLNSFSALVEGPDHNLYGTTGSGGQGTVGTIFRIDPVMRTYTVIHAFDYGTEGGLPESGLTLGTDGNFYGTTYRGGPTSVGTIYKMEPSGAVTVLYPLQYGTDGGYPYAGVVRGPDGSLYGTTSSGGPGGYGTAFKLDPTGHFSVLHGFNWNDGGSPLGPLVQGQDGSLYGTTYYGGPIGAGTVFKIDPMGTFSTLHPFDYTTGAYPWAGLLYDDTDGSLYGTTILGGTSGNGVVFKIDPTGVATVLHSFDRYNEGGYPYGGLVRGSLIGTTNVGSPMGFGTIFELDPASGSLSTLHVFSSRDGINSQAALVRGQDGSLYGTAPYGGVNNGGTVFRLTKTPSALALGQANGIYAGTTTLPATLTSSGAPVVGRQVNFTLNGLAVGSVPTDGSGVATLGGLSLSGINAGSYPGVVRASFAGDHWYPAAANVADLVVDKRATHLAWATPADIIYGTPLGSGQLNVSADVPGTSVYSPVAGTQLSIGTGQNLSVVFTPADSTNYLPSNANRLLNVIDSSAAICVSRPGGLVGWWSGEGNGIDRIGAHTAALQGGVTFASGRVGQGFSFPAPGRLVVPPSSGLDLTRLTLEAWVKFDALPSGFGTIATKQDSSYINYSLFVTSKGELAFYWVDPAGTHSVVSSGVVMNAGVFHHVAAAVDGTRVRFYMDGVPAWDEAQESPLIAVSGAPFTIGSEPDSDQFYGVIDEVALYDHALSFDEVRGVYLAGVRGKCPLPAVLDVSSTVAPVGGTTGLRAVLTSNAVPLPGQTVTFALNGADAGSAVTDGSGVAAVGGVGIGALAAGVYPNVVVARFAGDATYQPVESLASLTVVDAVGPAISIVSPVSGAFFGKGTIATASYSCVDPSSVATCAGPVPDGGYLDTAALGPHTFTVTSTDRFGNASMRSVDYTVIELPRIVVDSPSEPIYELGSVVLAQYSCVNADTCIGDVANGTALDTSTPGIKSFTINASGPHGNLVTQFVTYVVSLGSCVTPFPNMTAWLPGDGAATDELGGSSTWVGAARYEAGRVRKAFSFGSGSYVTLPLVQPASFTLQGWVRTTNRMLAPGTGIVSTGVAGQEAVSAQIELDGAGNYQVVVGNYDLVLFIGPATPSFQHIAVTYDQATGIVMTYLNGAPTDLEFWMGSADLGIKVLNLGINRQATGTPFGGAIDEWQAFSRSLSGDEVWNTFQTGALGLCKADNPPYSVPLVTVNPAEATSPAGATVTLNGTGSHDPDGDTLTYTWLAGSTTLGTGSVLDVPLTIGSHLITLTVDDGRGKTDSTDVTAVVRDTTPPVISGMPGPFSPEATGPAGVAVRWGSPTAADIVDVSVDVTCVPASRSTFPVGSTTVTCSATDVHLNSSQKTFGVTVNDTTPPELAGVPTGITAEAKNPAGADVSWPPPTSADLVDGSVAVTCVPASGSVFALGTTPVECSATDAHGNRSHRNFDVVVQDTKPPVLSGVPSTRTFEAANAGGAIGTWPLPTAFDLVDGVVPVSCTPASGSLFGLGDTMVTCSAIDRHTNHAEAIFAVHVVDTVGPALLLPASAGAEAAGPLGAPVTYAAGANDAVSGSAPISCSPASGSTFGIGVTAVTCSATDGAGNTSVAEFPVVVRDTTAPAGQITTPSADAMLATSPVLVNVQASDLVAVTGVTILGTSASLTAGSAQSGTWSASVPVSITPGAAIEFRAVIRDNAGNSTEVVRIVDNDGIQSAAPPAALAPFALDRGRTTGNDQTNVFSSEFNNGITSGTFARNGWTTTLGAVPAPPRPLGIMPIGFWPTTGWVQVAVTGSAAPAQAIVSACTGRVKQVRLDAVGERAAFACDPVTGTIAVKALSASPMIEVWKQISESSWLGIPLLTGMGISTGSPTTALADNPAPIEVKVVRYDDRGVAHVIGTFRLEPGATADVSVNPDAAGQDDSLVFHALRGTVAFTMGGVVHVLEPGAAKTMRIDRTPPRIDVQRPRAGAVYVLNQPVTAAFSCADAQSGVSSCEGTAPSGSAIAASVGSSMFNVFASDEAGNSESASVSFAVTYAVELVEHRGPMTREGDMLHLALRIADAQGVNRSDESITVRARGAAEALPFDAQARVYLMDVNVAGLSPGKHQQELEVGGDPVVHGVIFVVE
jgi:uncharacterized repeat protein (TIGR03803 family)